MLPVRDRTSGNYCYMTIITVRVDDLYTISNFPKYFKIWYMTVILWNLIWYKPKVIETYPTVMKYCQLFLHHCLGLDNYNLDSAFSVY